LNFRTLILPKSSQSLAFEQFSVSCFHLLPTRRQGVRRTWCEQSGKIIERERDREEIDPPLRRRKAFDSIKSRKIVQLSRRGLGYELSKRCVERRRPRQRGSKTSTRRKRSATLRNEHVSLRALETPVFFPAKLLTSVLSCRRRCPCLFGVCLIG